MDAISFLDTIYISDSAFKSLLIDGCNSEIKMQLTCISRVRSESWDYYSAEDLIDGYVVFSGVTSVTFEPNGVIPNDAINVIYAEKIAGTSTKYLITASIDFIKPGGHRTEVEVKIEAESIALEDIANPGVRITE